MTFVPRTWRVVAGASLLLVTLAIAAPVMAATIAVSIVDKTYSPADIIVAEGDTVTWTVTKSINEPHTVTSGTADAADTGKLFDSGLGGDKLKADGATYSMTFSKAGTYAYFCQVHPADMKGTVTVLAAGTVPGGEAEAGIAPERRLVGAGILVVTLVVLFGAAIVWRRMNPA